MRWRVLKCVLFVGPKGKWNLWVKYQGNSCVRICVWVHPCACIWVWYKHVCTTGTIIKVSNYRQTSELCILFSQTNEWADFDGTQRRVGNVWRVQTVAWETNDTSLKWFISVQLNDIILKVNILFELFVIQSEQRVLHTAQEGWGGHTLLPFIPLAPGVPASPFKP